MNWKFIHFYFDTEVFDLVGGLTLLWDLFYDNLLFGFQVLSFQKFDLMFNATFSCRMLLLLGSLAILHQSKLVPYPVVLEYIKITCRLLKLAKPFILKLSRIKIQLNDPKSSSQVQLKRIHRLKGLARKTYSALWFNKSSA